MKAGTRSNYALFLLLLVVLCLASDSLSFKIKGPKIKVPGFTPPKLPPLPNLDLPDLGSVLPVISIHDVHRELNGLKDLASGEKFKEVAKDALRKVLTEDQMATLEKIEAKAKALAISALTTAFPALKGAHRCRRGCWCLCL